MCIRDRYNSKMKVFVYQSMSLLIITLIDMVVLYAVGIISAYIILGVYDNWHIDGSLFYNTVTRKGFSADIGVYEAVMYIMFILRKTVIAVSYTHLDVYKRQMVYLLADM